MRKLISHKVNGLNEALEIEVLDEPGPGNACHQYEIWIEEPGKVSQKVCTLSFQKGPVLEVGFNGISHEALLAILLDRLEGFQSGAFACEENRLALLSVHGALFLLQKRTKDRMARGVEGTNQK
jgi:hypothetical protein